MQQLVGAIHRLRRFCHQFVFGPWRSLLKSTETRKLDPYKTWKPDEWTLDQYVTTVGTQWLRYANGNWQLLETEPIKREAAIVELLEKYGLTEFLRRSYLTKKGIGIVSYLDTCLELGLPLYMEDFARTCKAEIAYGDPGREVRVREGRNKAKYSES